MADSSTEARRANLTLRAEGVAPHDELLFKSLVRLLNYRTQHNWTFSTGAVDLRVLGEGTLDSVDGTTSENVLWVGHSEPHRTPFLHLPIHANELELLLNTLGSNILKKQKTAQEVSTPSLPRNKTFMLQRWPPSSLLGSPMRIKLATLMTAQPISMDTLVLRSGAALHDCEMFCQELDRADMLQRHDTAAGANPRRTMNERPVSQAKPDLSLLARIRLRLGI